MTDEELEIKIKDRLNKVKIGLLIFASVIFACMVGVFLWKFGNAPINFDFTDFQFSDLLSLFLALFTIALSATFYFQTTATSNRFYDNTYKFTQNVSETLGRMEEKFGEKLKNLHEGYTGLSQKFDRFQKYGTETDPEKSKREIKQEINRMKEVKKERDDLIEELLDMSKLQQKGREDFKEKLEKKENQLQKLEDEVYFLREKLDKQSMNLGLTPEMSDYIREVVFDYIPPDEILGKSKNQINRKFDQMKEDLDPKFLEDLREIGLFTDEGLTDFGIIQLHTLAELAIR